MNTEFSTQQNISTESVRLSLLILELIDEDDLVVTFYDIMKNLDFNEIIFKKDNDDLSHLYMHEFKFIHGKG